MHNNQVRISLHRHRLHAELLAFDPRAFSSLLTRELSVWFFARHRNFVGLTYFVFSVEFRFRVNADWSRSCTEIAGLWTHVHSFPLAAFDGCVGVAFLVLLLRFWVFLLFSAACTSANRNGRVCDVKCSFGHCPWCLWPLVLLSYCGRITKFFTSERLIEIFWVRRRNFSWLLQLHS